MKHQILTFFILIYSVNSSSLALQPQVTTKADREQEIDVIGNNTGRDEVDCSSLELLACAQECCCGTQTIIRLDREPQIDVIGDNTGQDQEILAAIAQLACAQDRCCEELKNQCAHTPITAPQTITSPGAYCLANDIFGTITIAANSVNLDLNGYSIQGNPAIVIQSGIQNSAIRNGRVENLDGSGIVVNQNVNGIFIESMLFDQCGNANTPYALQCAGTVPCPVVNCQVQNCTFKNCLWGVLFNSTNNVEVKNCIVNQGFSTIGAAGGFVITGSSRTHEYQNCTLFDIISTASTVYGFLIENADDIIVSECNISTLTGTNNAAAIGLFESKHILISDCNLIGVNTFEDLINTVTASGIKAINCLDCTIKKTLIQGIGNDSAPSHLFGLFVDGGGSFVADQLIVDDIRTATTQAVGILINAPISLITNSKCTDISSLNQSAAYCFANDACVAQYCNAQDVTATTTAIGFKFAGLTQNEGFQMLECNVQRCNSDNFAVGFYLENSLLTAKDCSSSFILAPLHADGFLTTTCILVLEDCDANLSAAFDPSGVARGFYFQQTQVKASNCNAWYRFGGNVTQGFCMDRCLANLTNCSTGACSAGNQNQGFYIGEGSSVLTNCQAENLDCSVGVSYLFHLSQFAGQPLLVNCIAKSASSPSVSRGFFIEGQQPVLKHCIATNVQHTGFEIAPNANQSVLIGSTATDNGEYGIIDNGNSSRVCDSYATNNGINNYSVGIPFIVLPGDPPIVCGNVAA